MDKSKIYATEPATRVKLHEVKDSNYTGLIIFFIIICILTIILVKE
jgi:hypothetical protein